MKQFAKNIIRRLHLATQSFLISWRENGTVNTAKVLDASPRPALTAKEQEDVYAEIKKTQEAKMVLEARANSLVRQEVIVMDEWLHHHLERIFGKDLLQMYHDERRRIPNVETHYHVNWDTSKMEKRTRIRVYVKEAQVAECDVVVSEQLDVPYRQLEPGEIIYKKWDVRLEERDL